MLDGYYEETYDYGAVFENNIVTISWTEQPLTSFGMTTVVKMAVLLDGITYTPYVEGALAVLREPSIYEAKAGVYA